MTPLNGTKTHPLTAFALGILKQLAAAPVPAQEINPGVSNRLQRENLAEFVDLPSPYKKHKGGKTAFMQITEEGRLALSRAKLGQK